MAFWSPPANLPLRRRRSPKLIALGVLLALLAGLALVAVHQMTTATTTALKTTRVIPQGEVIKKDDVTVVDVVGLADYAKVPADQLDEVVGQTALRTIEANSLVIPGSYGKPEVTPGQVRVGLHLGPGRVPAGEIPIGTRLRLFGPVGNDTTPEVIGTAVVVSTPHDTPNGARAFDIEIASDTANKVLNLIAAKRLAVAREP